MAMSPGVIAAIVVCCCLVLIVTVGIYFAMNSEDEAGSPAGTPGPAPSPSDPCAGLTPSSLAKDIPVNCLQKIWTDKGCSVTGTVYPVAGFKGWWNSSPGGLGTMVLCDGGKISGDAAGNCGAGNYGAVVADMTLWATSTVPGSVTEPFRVPGCRGPQS